MYMIDSINNIYRDWDNRTSTHNQGEPENNQHKTRHIQNKKKNIKTIETTPAKIVVLCIECNS